MAHWRDAGATAPAGQGRTAVGLPRRVWIDTDAACGHARTADPDDCLAILLLARSPGVELVGISTVFGNASLDVTDRTARELAAMLQREGVQVPVYRGAALPVDRVDRTHPAAEIETPAQSALARAIDSGPLTILSLGPVTNLELTLRRRPALAGAGVRLVGVMGRRPGHLFTRPRGMVLAPSCSATGRCFAT